ncbi:MAG: glycosyltransferase [Leptolyngbyaceae cyanobacterium bins.302]|nr:glycosyltransferase [Leptolyngbyaceae cyanobacterium bins.302]
MLRVVSIAGIYQPDRCGVAHYTAQLRHHLQSCGIQSLVLTTHAAAATVNQPDVMGVVEDWTLSALIPLVRSLQTLPFDLLHIQHAAGTYRFERAIFLLPLLLKMTGWRKPIVTTIHEYGWWEWQPAWFPSAPLEWLKQWGQAHYWWDREDGFLLTHSDAIITTNDEAETVLRTRLPAFHDRIHRIPIAPNVEAVPIDRATARRSLRQTCNWHDDTEIIVFFGFLHPVKGLETLLSVFKQVVATRPQARLLFVGGVESLALAGTPATHYWEQLHTLVTDLNLKDAVHFTGYVAAETASRYLSGADLGVLPFNHGVTLKSGSLLTLLAHRLPVIATAADPPDPNLVAAPWLKLVAPRKAHELTTGLLELLHTQKGSRDMGIDGLQFAQHFTWDTIAAAHLKIYRNV